MITIAFAMLMIVATFPLLGKSEKREEGRTIATIHHVSRTDVIVPVDEPTPTIVIVNKD